MLKATVTIILILMLMETQAAWNYTPDVMGADLTYNYNN